MARVPKLRIDVNVNSH